jgi:transposase
MKLIRVGIDLAKIVFQADGVDGARERCGAESSRGSTGSRCCEPVEPGCEIDMESCGGAHHRARRLQARWSKVRVIAPQFVRPYVKSNKNDANDAEAI